MTYSANDIKQDISKLDARQFFLKYILRSDNWYFENILGIPDEETMRINDDFKTIVSSVFRISFNSAIIVGSSKTGYSLSPNREKTFKEFCDDGKEREASDIDIAIVSSRLFYQYWDLTRKVYNYKYDGIYQYISRTIYRGYIDEYNLQRIAECRQIWNEIADKSKKELKNNLYFRHNISYRIY
jgi:hypothetical protein